MKLIVGLGNPGQKYKYNRHNIGFMQLDYFAKKNNIEITGKKFKALHNSFFLNNEKIVLIKPQTFMNLSGEAVSSFKNYFKLETNSILIVYDDIHLPFGKFRLRQKGSAGGHNGIKSIIKELATNVFTRLRIGIDKPLNQGELHNYVLSDFNEEEKRKMSYLLDKGNEIIDYWLKYGDARTMNMFN